MRPCDRSKGVISKITFSPHSNRTANRRARAGKCASTTCPFGKRTRYRVFGKASITAPSTVMASLAATSKSPVPLR